MIKDTYNYMFHCNEYTGLWHCFHSDDTNAYWSGSFNHKGEQYPIRVSSGKTPDEAWKNMQLLNELVTEI